MDSDGENKPSGARRRTRGQECDNKRAGAWGRCVTVHFGRLLSGWEEFAWRSATSAQTVLRGETDANSMRQRESTRYKSRREASHYLAGWRLHHQWCSRPVKDNHTFGANHSIDRVRLRVIDVNW